MREIQKEKVPEEAEFRVLPTTFYFFYENLLFRKKKWKLPEDRTHARTQKERVPDQAESAAQLGAKILYMY